MSASQARQVPDDADTPASPGAGEPDQRSVGEQLSAAAGWTGRAMARAYDGSRREYRRLAERMRDPRFLDVAFDEIDGLRFPAGHPRRRVVYVGHPLVPPVYRPMADFHRYLFQQRVVEAMQMLRALGAVELDIEHVRGRSTASEVEEGRQSWTGTSALSSRGRRRERSQQVLAHFEYPVTGARPHLPDGLVWAVQEPLWMEIADGRLTRGLTSFTLEIRDVDDYGVRRSVALSALGAGLSLGGSYDEHQETVWRLKGRFSPLA